MDVYRSTSHRVVSWLGAVVAGAVGIAMIVVGLAQTHAAGNDIVGAVFVVIALYLVRVALASVIAAPSAPHVIVDNPLRTHTIPWPEVEGFVTVRSALQGRGSRRRLIKLKRSDGHLITCVGVCAWGEHESFKLNAELGDAYSRHQLGKTRSSPLLDPSYTRRNA
ncbi:MAG TPA: hypothetical protein VG223_11155 [Solirubrobacteraceae bacterium]|nr:hypothetical protein [Solirubrobacteraceae bacterium]